MLNSATVKIEGEALAILMDLGRGLDTNPGGTLSVLLGRNRGVALTKGSESSERPSKGVTTLELENEPWFVGQMVGVNRPVGTTLYGKVIRVGRIDHVGVELFPASQIEAYGRVNEVSDYTVRKDWLFEL